MGDWDGKEVVQLYIRDVKGTYIRPYRELKDYKKLLFQKGETKTISFELGYDELGFYMPSGEYVVEKGMFEIYIGTDCKAENKLTLEVI